MIQPDPHPVPSLGFGTLGLESLPVVVVPQKCPGVLPFALPGYHSRSWPILVFWEGWWELGCTS